MTPEKIKKILSEWYDFEQRRIDYFKKENMFSDKIAGYEMRLADKKSKL